MLILSGSEDLYAFIPSLRRYQPVSSLARCSQTAGMDFTPDDYRSGFDANLTQMKVDYLGEKKLLALSIRMTTWCRSTCARPPALMSSTVGVRARWTIRPGKCRCIPQAASGATRAVYNRLL